MNNTKVQVITHLDLDGVVSYLVLCWLYGKKLDVLPTTPRKLQEDYAKLESSKTWDKLWVVDLDVSAIGEQIDKENTIIFDHHKTNLYSFKKAKTNIAEYSSCSKLLYDKIWSGQVKELDVARKTLIALADDWDSNKKTTNLSHELNIVFHAMSNKFHSFVEEYYNGFKPFDKFQTNTIALYNKHCKEYTNLIKPYIGVVDFVDQKEVKVAAVFCDKFVQECCDHVLAKYDVDVAIAVMLQTQRIAVRRNSNNTKIDVSQFVQRIASGGGHAAAAGGSLTEDFIEFTKMLKLSE
jgi:oligoribonuclease NrnB/cAMP/cGMP phosphodiesterase (DHH superfamily)